LASLLPNREIPWPAVTTIASYGCKTGYSIFGSIQYKAMMPILARLSFLVWPGRLGDRPNAGWNLMQHPILKMANFWHFI